MTTQTYRKGMLDPIQPSRKPATKMITTQKQLRKTFWETFPELTQRRGPRGRILEQNEQPTDTRCTWLDWLDALSKDGSISDALAGRATL